MHTDYTGDDMAGIGAAVAQHALGIAGHNVACGFRNQRGSEILLHCQEAIKHNRYGPAHNLNNVGALVTPAGHPMHTVRVNVLRTALEYYPYVYTAPT